jgi:hypothetical protein
MVKKYNIFFFFRWFFFLFSLVFFVLLFRRKLNIDVKDGDDGGDGVSEKESNNNKSQNLLEFDHSPPVCAK